MSKIVCDICGTTYDDTAGSCPVCGWSQGGNLDVDTADLDTDFLDEIQEEEAAAPAPKGKVAFDYDAVNNRRRPAPKASQVTEKAEEAEDEDDEEEEESGSNTFLVIILVLLILALLAVSAYIGWTKILKPKQMGNENNKPQETVAIQIDETTEPVFVIETTEATEPGVPCTGLSLVGSMEKLTFEGQYWRLMVKSEPEDTTDEVVFTSGDESVVTIDEYGRVTAIGEGETVIVITCGDQRIETPAVVHYESETAVETVAPTNAPAAPAASESGTTVATPSSVLKLKKTDITIGRAGVYVTLEIEGGIAAEDIKWSTSDSRIATVYNGNVTALGRGTCVITAEYNGQTAQCVVRCKF